MLFRRRDPAWGVLGADGQVQQRQDGVLADLRGQRDQLRVSADGRRVRFGYLYGGKDACVFDLATGSLGPDEPNLPAARTEAPGLKIEQWEDSENPTLNGKPLKLDPLETSRSLAIAPDGRRFALGAEWSLRMFDREGAEVWNKAVPGVVWAVTISGDGRFVVAGYGDGTIRWHRVSDGKELLAFFPHADRKRWIAWTPEGFFSASPGAEDLIGFHLNRGKDREGEFVSARQLWETFYQPGLIAGRLDADGDERIAAAVKQRGDVRELLKAGQTPELELLSPAEAESEGTYTLKVRIKRIGGGEGRLVVGWTGRNSRAGGRRPPSRRAAWSHCHWIWQEANAQSPWSWWTAAASVRSPSRHTSMFAKRSGDRPALHVLAVGVANYRDRALAEGVAFAADDAAT